MVSPEYYPVFLNLRNKQAVIIGGGKVAERKMRVLLNAEANVTIISPRITPHMEKAKRKGSITHIKRRYRKGDVKKAFLVIAATDSFRTNELIADEAPCLVNVVDTPHLCNFIVPSLIQRGSLTIAISTGGVSPAIARSIRRELEKIYGSEFSAYLRALKRLRNNAMNTVKDPKKRGALLKSFASDEMIRTLRTKGVMAATKTAKDLLERSRRGSCNTL